MLVDFRVGTCLCPREWKQKEIDFYYILLDFYYILPFRWLTKHDLASKNIKCEWNIFILFRKT